MSNSASSSKYAGDPAVDAAVLQQMAYKSSYTESINKQMRVPQTITVAEQNGDYKTTDHHFKSSSIDYTKNAPLLMEVPDRIVVSVGEDGVKYGKGERDLAEVMHPDEIRSPIPLALQTPPRVLTLQDRNLDSLDIDTTNPKSDDDNEEDSSTHARPTALQLNTESNSRAVPIDDDLSVSGSPRSLFDSLQFESKKFYREVLLKLNALTQSDFDFENRNKYSELDLANQSEDLDDITVLKNEVFRLHKRVVELEQQKRDKSHLDFCFYGITIGFWLFNAWFLFSHRR